MTGRSYWGVVLLAIALGAALHAPSMGAGYAADDYLQIAMADGAYPVSRHPLDYYRFVDASRGELRTLMDAGTMPWWSHPDLKIAAMRPLSSALIELEHSTLRLSPTSKHLHSLAWWAACVVAAASLLKRLLPLRVAALGCALFALDPAHVLPVGWLANRAALISTALGLFAASMHVAWRAHGSKIGRFFAPAFTGLALFAGEYGLTIVALITTYEIFAAPGDPKKRLLCSAPALGCAGAYLAAHWSLGYGARGSAVYVDPFASPVEFATEAPQRFLALTSIETLGPFAAQSTQTGLVAALLVACALLWLGARGTRRLPDDQRRAFWALLAGAGLAAVPMLGTAPSSRLLVVPSAMGAGVFATMIVSGIDSARNRSAPVGLRAVTVVVTVALAAIHALASPLTTFVEVKAWRQLLDLTNARMSSADIDDGDAGQRSLILINALHLFNVLYPPHIRHAAGSPMPASWRVLATTPYPLQLTRVDARTVEIHTEHPLFVDPTAVLFRHHLDPLTADDTVDVRGLTIRVVDATPRGPTRVRYEFEKPLEDPTLSFLVIGASGLAPAALPAPGQSTTVAGALSRGVL